MIYARQDFQHCAIGVPEGENREIPATPIAVAADRAHELNAVLLEACENLIWVVDQERDPKYSSIVRILVRLPLGGAGDPLNEVDTRRVPVVAETDERNRAFTGRTSERCTRYLVLFFTQVDPRDHLEAQHLVELDGLLQVGDIDVDVVDPVQVHVCHSPP